MSETVREGYFRVKGFVEKPTLRKSTKPIGLFLDDMFSLRNFFYLKNAKTGVNGEIQLTDSMNDLAARRAVFAQKLQSQRFDAGDKLGYLKANIEVGLHHPEVKEDLEEISVADGGSIEGFLRNENSYFWDPVVG